MYKFAATHCAFAVTILVLLVVAYNQGTMADGASSLRHTMNTINAVLTLSMVALTKSCLKVLDCTNIWRYSGRVGTTIAKSTLDAMPDIDCDSESFWTTRLSAMLLLFIYICIIPVALFAGLAIAKRSGRINDHEYLQGHGWFLLKYRPVRTALHLISHPSIHCSAAHCVCDTCAGRVVRGVRVPLLQDCYGVARGAARLFREGYDLSGANGAGHGRALGVRAGREAIRRRQPRVSRDADQCRQAAGLRAQRDAGSHRHRLGVRAARG